jgi:hypothetical protein
MAIGKITKGSGFGGVCGYALAPDKKPRVLSHCGVGDDLRPRAVASSFRRVSNLRPTVTKPVRHLSISFAPEDGALSDEIKNAIVDRVLRDLGYQNCQYIAIDHDRADPGHSHIHDHDHLHIITNAVDFFGNYVRDSWERYKIQSSLREVELEFGLRQVESSWEIKATVSQAPELTARISQTLTATPTLSEWLAQLQEQQIDVRFNLTHRGMVRGVSFIDRSRTYKGSDLELSWQKIYPQLQPSLDDLQTMTAANKRSQTLEVVLDERTKQLFDRACELAVLKLGNNPQFKNNRVQIESKDDTLTITRIRPNKIMLTAERIKDAWEPVGNPHLDRKDIQLLERTNGIKPTVETKRAIANITAFEETEELETESNLQLEI